MLETILSTLTASQVCATNFVFLCEICEMFLDFDYEISCLSNAFVTRNAF